MRNAKQHKETVRLNFEFPLTQYPYLKMVCAKKGLTLRDFATEVLIKAIEETEDEMLAQRANERLESMSPEDLISWNEAIQSAGWNRDNL